MKKAVSRAVAVALAVVMIVCALPVMSASAATSYPNTHENTGDQASDIVAVAMTQEGYCEGSLSGNPAYASTSNYQKYGQWYDANVDNIGGTYAAWCAMFVSWCANQAGIPSSIMYYHAYCPYGVNWFKDKGQFSYSQSRGGSYTPKAGDIIYFQSSTVASHVGIVRYSSGGYVYTIEGNTSGQNGEVNEGGGAFAKKYSLGYANILGYGKPAYETAGYTVSFDSRGGSSVTSQRVQEGKTATKPTDPTRYGFEFAGWFDENDWEFDFSNTAIWANRSLYAKWTPVSWPQQTNYMPTESNTVVDEYENEVSYVWPYFGNADEVTLYKGGDEHGWPSITTTYEKSVNLETNAYLNIVTEGNAKFNANITVFDADGNKRTATLSRIVSGGDDDFSAGDYVHANVGAYLYTQGYNMPSDSIVNIVSIQFFVVGTLDQYVTLKSVKFEGTPEYQNGMVPETLSQSEATGITGNYSYNDGTLAVSGKSGYTVSFAPQASFSPEDLPNWLVDVSSTGKFDVVMIVSTSDGDKNVSLRDDFFNRFGYETYPTEGLDAGSYVKALDLLGVYTYNNCLPADGVSTIKKVSVKLLSDGTVTMKACQVSNSEAIFYLTDGKSASGSWGGGNVEISSEKYDIDDNTGLISGMVGGTLFADFSKNVSGSEFVKAYDGANELAVNSPIKTGTVIKVFNGNTEVSSYVAVVIGDVDCDGAATSRDGRQILTASFDINTWTAAQKKAGDVNGDGNITSADSRTIIVDAVA